MPAITRSAAPPTTTISTEIMHGSSFQGNGKQALYSLADEYEKLIAAAA